MEPLAEPPRDVVFRVEFQPRTDSGDVGEAARTAGNHFDAMCRLKAATYRLPYASDVAIVRLKENVGSREIWQRRPECVPEMAGGLFVEILS